MAEFVKQDREPEKGSLVVPVIAEDLSVSKQTRTTATVRVSKSVHRREETVDLPLLRNSIQVERVSLNTLHDEQPSIRQEGGTTIYPVFKEVAVVVRKFLLKEEVRVSRREISEPYVESVVLRTEEVTVERDESPQVAGNSALESLSNLTPFTDGSFCFTETMEEAVVVKHARVIEEIVLQKSQSERTEVVHDTLRHSEIVSELVQNP